MARASKYEDKKLLLLRAIFNAAAQHTRPPTVRDLAGQAQVGVSTIHSYLEKLAEEGLVEWRPKSHRSLRCTPLAIQTLASRDA